MKPIGNKVFVRYLRSIGACIEAVDWVKEHGGNSAELWRDCKRGDWMEWIACRGSEKFGITKRELVGAKADCAWLVLKYYEKEYPNDKSVRNCLKVCRAYSKGKVTDDDLATYVAHYASSVSYAFYTSAAPYAFYASAADAAAYAAPYVSAATVAYAAATAFYASVAHAASTFYAAVAHACADRNKIPAKCADIYRRHFPQFMESEK